MSDPQIPFVVPEAPVAETGEAAEPIDQGRLEQALGDLRARFQSLVGPADLGPYAKEIGKVLDAVHDQLAQVRSLLGSVGEGRRRPPT